MLCILSSVLGVSTRFLQMFIYIIMCTNIDVQVSNTHFTPYIIGNQTWKVISSIMPFVLFYTLKIPYMSPIKKNKVEVNWRLCNFSNSRAYSNQIVGVIWPFLVKTHCYTLNYWLTKPNNTFLKGRSQNTNNTLKAYLNHSNNDKDPQYYCPHLKQ